jgi:hypothetical protein
MAASFQSVSFIFRHHSLPELKRQLEHFPTTPNNAMPPSAGVACN